jgi:hypothetical protein
MTSFYKTHFLKHKNVFLKREMNTTEIPRVTQNETQEEGALVRMPSLTSRTLGF